MDKWEDTVMSLDEYNRFTEGYYEKQGKSKLWCEANALGAEYKATLGHQAEISFKAGEDKGKQEGFDKVAKWHLEPCPHFEVGYKPKGSCEECWQAFLKERLEK